MFECSFTYPRSASQFVKSLCEQLETNFRRTLGAYHIANPNDGKKYSLTSTFPDVEQNSRFGNTPYRLTWHCQIDTLGEMKPEIKSDGETILLPEILHRDSGKAIVFDMQQIEGETITTRVDCLCASEVWQPFFDWLLALYGQPTDKAGQPAMQEKGAHEAKPSTITTPDEQLTAREQEVARLYAKGMDTKEISKALVITPKTVRTHRQSIARKLGISSDEKTVVSHLSKPPA